MNADRWRRIERIYHGVMACKENERAEYLGHACAGDETLRTEVESLLAHDRMAEGSWKPPAVLAAADMLLEDDGTSLRGRTLGSYRLQSLLGAGGMGRVYRARDTRLGRDVAVKVLPGFLARDPVWRERFEHEARFLAAFNHPHIAAIHGLEQFDDVHALVLELVEGPTLADRISGGPVPITEALTIARQIATALEASHQKGIVHRDLKPANIKITDGGTVKVLDFGLAKAFVGDRAVPDLPAVATPREFGTIPGVILGTPAYMSPEQARGRPVDVRCDIWAFGCVVYELLSGRPAFSGDTVSDTIARVLEREPEWHHLPSSTPQRVRDLLQRCLTKDVAHRLRDIRDARLEIEAVMTEADAGSARAAHRLLHFRNTMTFAASAVGVAALAALIVSFSWRRIDTAAGTRSSWVQITNFPDSVTQPALSPDGRMLTFVRGPSTFIGPGDIYVKILPDGEPQQLTRSDSGKMSPVFSPDGSRIAYTVSGWDTWIIPVLGGEPRQWLPNASGLVWIDSQRLLFSEIKTGSHMAIVTATESRAAERDVYVPSLKAGMAHRSHPSPDGKWVLVVEMQHAPWLPCRLVPMDGSTQGRQVGPEGAACTAASWSPDGEWMYMSSGAGGAFHIWRQRFPNGEPEQVTSGPTEEEGIAMAPDGRSFLTSVGLRQRSVWVRDSSGERQVSLEGYAYQPKFTPDGKKLLYRISKGADPSQDPTELWMADLSSGRAEPLLPGIAVYGNQLAYDVSSDGGQVVVESRDPEGKSRLWVAPLDRRSPPHLIPDVEGREPVFGADDEIFFMAREGQSASAYRVRTDGTGLRKAAHQPIAGLQSLSPDRQWLAASVKTPGLTSDLSTLLLPVAGGNPIRFSTMDARLKWHQSANVLVVNVGRPTERGPSAIGGHTYVVPLVPGRVVPDVPEEGFRAEAEIASLPGARLIDSPDGAPGPAPEVYAFSRETIQRNLYRIPVP